MIVGFQISNADGYEEEAVDYIIHNTLMRNEDALESLQYPNYVYFHLNFSDTPTVPFTVTPYEIDDTLFRNISGQKLEVPVRDNGGVVEYEVVDASQFVAVTDEKIVRMLKEFLRRKLLSGNTDVCIQTYVNSGYWSGTYMVCENG